MTDVISNDKSFEPNGTAPCLTISAKVSRRLAGKLIDETWYANMIKGWMTLLGNTTINAREHEIKSTAVTAISQRREAEPTSGREEVAPMPPLKGLAEVHLKMQKGSLLRVVTAVPPQIITSYAEMESMRRIRMCKGASVGNQPDLSKGREAWPLFVLLAALEKAAGASRTRVPPNSPTLHRLPSDPLNNSVKIGL